MPQSVSEVIVFVGLLAAGKTTYYRTKFAATHVHVSKDLIDEIHVVTPIAP